MTPSEKKILTGLSKFGPLTKRQLSEKGKMSWATVVKMINRLEEKGFVSCVGVAEQKKVQGKDSAVYDLSEQNPLSIGIDLEYTTTHIILMNLKDSIIHTAEHPTPYFVNVADIGAFVHKIIGDLLSEVNVNREHIAGVGVVLPAFLIYSETNLFRSLESDLRLRLDFKVRVDDVVRAYTLYKERQLYTTKSFLMITIRSGIGVGISLSGHVYRGDDNMAGELSHVIIDKNGTVCHRCGKRGCLETFVNEIILYKKHRALKRDILVGIESNGAEYSLKEIRAALEELFKEAENGSRRALAIVNEAADYLSQGIAILLMVLNISHIYLSGHFGDAGRILASLMNKTVERYSSHLLSHNIEYEPLQDDGFTRGASLLILRDYCEYEIA